MKWRQHCTNKLNISVYFKTVKPAPSKNRKEYNCNDVALKTW